MRMGSPACPAGQDLIDASSRQQLPHFFPFIAFIAFGAGSALAAFFIAFFIAMLMLICVWLGITIGLSLEPTAKE